MCGATVSAMVVPRGTVDPGRDARVWGWLRGYVLLRLADRTTPAAGVEPFPLREELPDEFSALAIDDPSGWRIVAINTRQSRDNARAALRKLGPAVAVPIGAGLLPDRIAKNVREHPGVALLVATSIAATALFGGITLTSDRDPQSRPPVAMQVAPPPATVTITATPRLAKTSDPPARPPAQTTDPAGPPRSVPTRKPDPPQAVPSPTRSDVRPPAPIPDPPEPTRSPLPEPTAPTSAPSPTQPPPGAPPSPPPARPTTTGEKPDDDCAGLLHVEIDPLLDACLLG
jgi:hypothetical protein